MIIGGHWQRTTDRWPEAVRQFPAGTPHKFVDGVQRAMEAKLASPRCRVVIRHHAEAQPWGGDPYAKARAFFASFVDESFLAIAQHVDYVGEWNEYFGNGQPDDERQWWISWARACAEVWREYRKDPRLAHIRLLLAATAVGNDIPLEVAAVAAEYDCDLDYHAYTPVWMGQIRPDEWPYYSGRWDQMDARFRRHGIRVRWFFGEAGAVGHNGPGWPNSLAASDGWRHPNVYNGNLDAYIGMLRYWYERTTQTVAFKEGRVIGAVLFTSGGGSLWKHFELSTDELARIGQAVSTWTPASEPQPPQPPPQPPPAATDGKPRLDYARVMHVAPDGIDEAGWLEICRQAYPKRQSVAFSYDDAGIGALSDKTAILHGILPAEQGIYRDWYAVHYPGTRLEFRELASGVVSGETYVPQPVIIDVVDELPRHAHKSYQLRPLEDITHLVVHHTVGDSGPHNIAAFHVRTRDWPGIGYHYVIERNGRIYQTNRHETLSWHTAAENHYSLGIALVGDFREALPSAEQLAAARELIAWLRATLPNARPVLGHRDMPGQHTECPGGTYTQWLDDIR